ncbi:MAG: hypothetical protein RL324_1653 [Verrucomicrobiota bacterium]
MAHDTRLLVIRCWLAGVGAGIAATSPSNPKAITDNRDWHPPVPGEQPVSQIIPKLFTGSSVKKLCSTNPSPLRPGGHGLDCSLIEQSKRGGLKRFAESTAGIIPGDRGKVGGSWCHPPLRIRVSGLAAGKSHQFLWSESCPAGFHESGAERLGAIRNRVRAESGPQEVSTCVPTYVTQRVMVATTNDQNAVTFPGGVHPCQKAPSLTGWGAQRKRDGAE